MKLETRNSKLETFLDCPRCGEGRLRGWSELNAEEREVVRRLPASADYTQKEREATHRWCGRCWYEEGNVEQRA